MLERWGEEEEGIEFGCVDRERVESGRGGVPVSGHHSLREIRHRTPLETRVSDGAKTVWSESRLTKGWGTRAALLSRLEGAARVGGHQRGVVIWDLFSITWIPGLRRKM